MQPREWGHGSLSGHLKKCICVSALGFAVWGQEFSSGSLRCPCRVYLLSKGKTYVLFVISLHDNLRVYLIFAKSLSSWTFGDGAGGGKQALWFNG